MKTHLKSLCLSALVLAMGMTATAQNFEKQWKAIEKAIDEDLPKTALLQLNEIRDEAVRTHNTPQLIRTLFTSQVLQQQIAPDSGAVCLGHIETELAKETRPVERALYQNALARLLLVQRPFGIEQNTTRAKQLLLSSLQNTEALGRARTKDFLPLFELGNSSATIFRDDVLSVLTTSLLEANDTHHASTGLFSHHEIDSILCRNLDFYEREGNRRAMLFTELQRADHLPLPLRIDFLEKKRIQYLNLSENTETYDRLFQEMRRSKRLDEAVALAREGLKRYGRKHAAKLRNSLQDAETPQLFLSWENPMLSDNKAFYPGMEYKAKIRSRNIRHLQVRFHLLNGLRGNDPRLGKALEDGRLERLLRQIPSKEELLLRHTLNAIPSHREYEDSISFRFPKAGVYLIELMADGRRKDLQLVHAAKAQRLIFHAVSHQGTILRTRFVDVVSGSSECLDNDSIYLPPYDYGQYTYGESLPLPRQRQQGHAHIFTDRAIYRPGQTVEISGLTYLQSGDSLQALKDWKGELSAYDAEGRKLETLSVISDEMGVFSTKLALPRYCRPGRFRITMSSKSDFRAHVYFRVEEYKRPTFHVTFDTLSAKPKLGDRVIFSGHVRTYNDLPVEKARVKWNLNVNSLWGIPTHSTQHFVQSGELTTDTAGTFRISVQLGDTIAGNISKYFILWAEALAENGETQKGMRGLIVRSDLRTPKVATKPLMVMSTDKEKAETEVKLYGKMFVHYDLISFNGGLLESKLFEVTDSAAFTHRWTEAYGDAAVAHYATVKDGKLHHLEVLVERPRPDKRLVLNWKSFRSRLQPGQEEEWTLSVKHPDGKAASANVMASLFDASLNAFSPHKWLFSLYFNRHRPYLSTSVYSAYTLPLRATYRFKQHDFPLLSWTRWRENMFSDNRIFTVGFGETRKETRLRGLSKMSDMPETYAVNASAVKETTPKTSTMEEEKESFDFTTVQPRKNFDETAFFMPRLRTNEKGEVSLRFTLPESLTQWQLNVLAHDAELRHALLSENIVARKLLMAEAALPRFLREGDETAFPVSVKNTDETSQKGIIHFTLSDADGKLLKAFRQPFDLAPGKSMNTFFFYAVPEGRTELIARVIAKSNDYSDGEEHSIPILSRQVTLTHSVPFTVKSGENATRKQEAARRRLLAELEKGIRPELSVDTCRDARSEVAKVVPTLLNGQGGSAIDKAIALYAIELAADLPQYLPMEAAELAARRAEAADRLRELQNDEGGWAWYPGMHTSAWITTDIAMLLARVSVLTGHQGFRPMLQRAVDYLDRFIKDEVKKMKEEKQPSFHLDEIHWRYLYIDRLLGRIPSDDVRHLLSRAARHRKELSMYGKSCQAVVLAGTKHDSEARLALQSIVEHTVFDEEMGRYFDTDRALQGHASYRIPTQTFSIEALDRLQSPDQTVGSIAAGRLVDEMRLWLLQSKRTQVWNTSRATADAVYTLLRRADDADKGMAWGAVTATYRLPAIAAAAKGNGLHLERRLEIKRGRDWTPVVLNENGETARPIHVGDRVRWVYTLTADRDFDHVVLRSSRPACFETAHPLSGYSWQNSLVFYRMVRDSSNEYFMEHLAKGRHVFTEEMLVDRAGRFDGGLSTLESVFSPEFSGNSSAIIVNTARR